MTERAGSRTVAGRTVAGRGVAGRTARAGALLAAEALAAAAAEVAAACVSVALLWAPQERLVWQPPRPRPRDRVPPTGAERLDYAAPDGRALFAWVVEPGAGRIAGTLLAFHGNAELAAWLVPWARAVAARTGWRMVLPEYRGYGETGGAPAYAHSAPDARAAYDALRRRWPEGPLALYGYSLGSAVAAELAAELAAADAAPAALVLEAPFTSARAMARLGEGEAARRWWARLGRVHFDTAAHVAALDVPVWVAHGALDAIVPLRMGRRVFRAARRRGVLLVVGAAGHTGVAARGGARYWAWLARALGAAAGAPEDAQEAAPGDAARYATCALAAGPPSGAAPPPP